MRAYVGLGSNLDHPAGQLRRALAEMRLLPATRLLKHSRFYHNPAQDFPGQTPQPDYLNAVAVLDTRLTPERLLRWLQKLEARHLRVRLRRWGPRTLDLDLLVYGALRRRHRRLILPHPRLHERAFVLYPLAEVENTLVIPGRGRLALLCTRCNPLKFAQELRSCKIHLTFSIGYGRSLSYGFPTKSTSYNSTA